MSKRLTALSVENAKPGTSRREISDGGHNGLHLIVQPSGHKSWAVRFRVGGKPRKLTLPAGLTLHEAREQAASAVREAHRGNDPTKAKKIARQKIELAKANTFAAVAALYLNTDRVKKLRTVAQITYRLTQLVSPQIGDRPVADLKRSQIVAALDHIERVNGSRQSDLCLSDISCVLHFYAKRSDDYVPPLVRGMKRTAAKDRARNRILTDDEIRAVWNTGNAFVRFLLLSCARRDEAASMQFKELSDNIWMLPAARNKTKVELARPLSGLTMKELPERGGDDEYVFGNTPDRPLSSFSALKSHLDKASGVTGWRLHDLRRTARTLLSRAGVNADHAERCLGHVIGGVRGVYDRHEFLSEKRHAYQALAHELELIIKPPKDNVTQLKRKKA
jgi:integrase